MRASSPLRPLSWFPPKTPAAPPSNAFFHVWIWPGWTSYRAASWATVSSPFTASKATLALNDGLCFFLSFDLSHSSFTATAALILGAGLSLSYLSEFPGPPQSQVKLDTVQDILAEVEEIYDFQGRDLRPWLYREILLNALKCKRDELDILDLKVINRSVDEFRYAVKVFKPYRAVRKVSIFGSARTGEDEPYYDLAVQFGRLMAKDGFMAITGAASGIMKAGIDGAGLDNSFGVNIMLP